MAGLALAEADVLLMTYDGRLARWRADSGFEWSVVLATPKKRGDRVVTSSPVALANGFSLALASSQVVVLDKRGVVKLRKKMRVSLDDSGPAPNIDQHGRLTLTAITGELLRFEKSGVEELRACGYDILPPAFYGDGTMAVSGYAGIGLVRLDEHGKTLWKAQLDEPDLLPSISSAGVLAAGSLNDSSSVFVAPDGKLLARYKRPAVFAEAPDGDWIALSKNALARVRSSGRIVWEHELKPAINTSWGALQPIVDAEGRIYVPTAKGISAFDEKGRSCFRLDLGAPPIALAPAGSEKLASVVDRHLVIVG
jgi:outer membrane protein assembly factor BamB